MTARRKLTEVESYASHLRPVAELITKAMNETPPNFAGKPPVILGTLLFGYFRQKLQS